MERIGLVLKDGSSIYDIKIKGLDNIYNAPILLVKDDITGYYQLCSEIA